MPPPSLSISTITSFRPSRQAAIRPPMSWARATSPIRRTTGPCPAAATPNAVETVPSMPLAPRLDSTRNRRGGPGWEERLDVAHRHRGGHDHQGLVGRAQSRSSPDTRGSLSSGPKGRSDRARGVTGPAACQPAPATTCPCAACGAAPPGATPSSRRVRGSPMIVSTEASGSCQAASASNAICTAPDDGQPRAQGLRGRQVTHPQHEVGRVRLGKRVGAQERVVVRDRRGPTARAGQRIRRAAGSRRARRTRPAVERQPRVALGRARHEHGPRGASHLTPAARR